MSKRSDEQQAIIGEFIVETEEALARIASALSSLEQNGPGADLLNGLYRDMHTIKGSAYLLGVPAIGHLTHAIESCLDPLRKLLVAPQRDLLDLFFKGVSLTEELIKGLRVNEDDEVALPKAHGFIPPLAESACEQFGKNIHLYRDHHLLPEEFLAFTIDSQKNETKEIGSGKETRNKPETIQKPLTENPPHNKEISMENNKIENKEPTPKIPVSEQTQIEHGAQAVDSTVRVQVSLLEDLMNVVSEMVLVRNQLVQYTNGVDDGELQGLGKKLDVVTSELQGQVMRTRMRPIGDVIGKFQRIIRDLARELGKQVDLTIQGKDTELDKTLLEAIKDPLTHIVRNSCDHGIEMPADRASAGKPANGHIFIRSFHEGGQVIIEISDDGRGLSRKKLMAKALSKNLITEQKANSLTDREILGLIFLPGFSTAEQVSSISGRGVGMDVVKTNIEKIGGSVELESVEGKGTTIRLKIPLTLAIVPALLVKGRDSTYAIPQMKLLELVRVDNNENENNTLDKIHSLQGRAVYELRGKIIPLVFLNEILHKEEIKNSDHKAQIIAIVSSDNNTFGLVVDEVLDSTDIVVKPLSKFLKVLDAYSAATILGTGEVALILDPNGIYKISNLAINDNKQEGVFSEAYNQKKITNNDLQEYLFFKSGKENGTFAVPLCMVARLEEFKTSALEHASGRSVVQYRGSILPLIEVASIVTDNGERLESESIQTIVATKSGKSFGLVVETILDVMAIDGIIDESLSDRPGILGGLVAGDEVVTVIDVLAILEQEMKKHPENPALEEFKSPMGLSTATNAPKKVLYAEDVSFFRKQVSKLLKSHGMEVIDVADGKAALDILLAPNCPRFELILSDIEMPVMNGLELAQNIRQINELKNTPLIALTTRFAERDIKAGMEAGFNCYMEKLNPDALMQKIRELLDNKDKAVA